MPSDLQLDEPSAFSPFFARGLIRGVLGPIKSGKEATVYLCNADPAHAGAELVAVKVYTDRGSRRFRNAAIYEDMRSVLDERARRAIVRKTAFGREAEHAMWVGREYGRMRALREAGVSVPDPIACEGTAIVMRFLGDEDGPAPRLKDVRLTREEASRAWRWLLYEVELMLGANVVHGDLSPYNVLWWEDRAWIIDLPQAVDPRFNRSARMLLERDVANLARYVERAGVRADPGAVTRDLWRRFMRSEL